MFIFLQVWLKYISKNRKKKGRNIIIAENALPWSLIRHQWICTHQASSPSHSKCFNVLNRQKKIQENKNIQLVLVLTDLIFTCKFMIFIVLVYLALLTLTWTVVQDIFSKFGWNGDNFLHQFCSFCSYPEPPTPPTPPVPLKAWLPDRLLAQHYYICGSYMLFGKLDFLISQEKINGFLVPVIVQIFLLPTKSL